MVRLGLATEKFGGYLGVREVLLCYSETFKTLHA